jgi:hypothetical protein
VSENFPSHPRSVRFYTVAVFQHDGKRGPRFNAYTSLYNPQWPGCCLHHEVPGVDSRDAKKLAIAEHRERCMNGLPIEYEDSP